MPVLSAPDAKGKAWRQSSCRTIPVFTCFSLSTWICLLTFQLILCGKYVREWQRTSDQCVTFLHVQSVTQMFNWWKLTSHESFTPCCLSVTSHSVTLQSRKWSRTGRGQAWPLTSCRKLLVKFCIRGNNHWHVLVEFFIQYVKAK